MLKLVFLYPKNPWSLIQLCLKKPIGYESKKEIIQAGLTGKLLPAKSSKHVFIDLEGNKRPLVSLSVIVNN
jgi:hypothetical protein